MNRRASYNSYIESMPELGKSQKYHVMMPGEALYAKPIHNPRRSLNTSQLFSRRGSGSNPLFPKPSRSSKGFLAVGRVSLRKSFANRALSSNSNIALEVRTNITPGFYPPKIEARILMQMRLIAVAKSEQGLFMEAHLVLRKVLECQLSSLGYDNPIVASTFYHLGVTLNKLGRPEAAIIELEKGLRILFPLRHRDKNTDLSAIFYEIGIIYGEKKKDYKPALYYLDLAKQVEINCFGHALDTTLHAIIDYQKKGVTRRRMSV